MKYIICIILLFTACTQEEVKPKEETKPIVNKDDSINKLNDIIAESKKDMAIEVLIKKHDAQTKWDTLKYTGMIQATVIDKKPIYIEGRVSDLYYDNIGDKIFLMVVTKKTSPFYKENIRIDCNSISYLTLPKSLLDSLSPFIRGNKYMEGSFIVNAKQVERNLNNELLIHGDIIDLSVHEYKYREKIFDFK